MVLQAEIAEILKSKYNVHFSNDSSKNHRFLGRDLLCRNGLLELLTLVGAGLQAPNMTVAASLLAKHYSHLLIAGGLFSTIHKSVHLDLSLDTLSLHTNEDWSPHLQVSETFLPCRQESLDSLFERNLRPFFRFLAQVGSIQESVLWAHAAFSVHYLFDLWVEEAGTREEKQHVEQTFAVLIAGLPEIAVVFNLIPHPLFPDKSLRIRKKCCLRYCLPGAGNCTTCPILNEEERVNSLKKYHGVG